MACKHGLRKQTESLTALQTAFFSGDAESVEKILNRFLINTITLRDNMRQKDAKESFYHGILLGLLSSEYVGSCVIKSNLEAGKGYCDIYMVNEDESIGAVVELKVAHNGTMETACNTAVEQIENKNYSEVFDPEITPKVYKYRIGCKKMHCKVKVI